MNTHTAVNTHPEQWADIYAAAPGEQLWVRCLAQEHLSRDIEGGESAGYSFESVRDRGARIILVSSGPRIAIHLSQFGTAERESFESVRDRGARII